MSIQKLKDKILSLSNCNPNITQTEHDEMISLASKAPSECFPELIEQVNVVIDIYLSSPPKQTARQLFKEYNEFIERSAFLLAEKNEINSSLSAINYTKTTDSASLLPVNIYDSLDWCKIISTALTPIPLKNAILACQNRHQEVQSVVEIALDLLQRVDNKKLTQWMIEYLEKNNESRDYDIIRDFLLVWLNDKTILPNSVLNYCQELGCDESVRQTWPFVSVLADRLLKNQIIFRLSQEPLSRVSSIMKLQLIGKKGIPKNSDILNWHNQALDCISESITFFMAIMQKKNISLHEKIALDQELKLIEKIYPYLLLCADSCYYQPQGIKLFALAFFGLAGRNKMLWEQNIQSSAERALRKMSLFYMSNNKSLDDFIEKFTFNNKQECVKLQMSLDLVSRNFPSLKMRDKIIGILASFYNSYREANLLDNEITRRYRDWRKLLHSDSLQQCLTEEDWHYWSKSDTLINLNSLCNEVRIFLNKRRSSTSSVEEMEAAELSFSKFVRQERAKQCKKLYH